MQVLVLYFSKTGRTKQLAEKIMEGVAQVEGVTAILRSTEEVTKEDFKQSEGIIAGSPVYFGTMAAELKLVIDKFVGVRKKMEGKVAAAFATGHHHTGGKETTILSIIQAFMIYGMIIVGDPLDTGGHYGIGAHGDLTDSTWEDGVKFGKRVAMVTKKLRSE